MIKSSHLSWEKVTVPDESVWFCVLIDDSLWGAFHTQGCVESDGFPRVIFLEDNAVGRWLGAASVINPAAPTQSTWQNSGIPIADPSGLNDDEFLLTQLHSNSRGGCPPKPSDTG
jgi:hypothetical protein